jgi:hypothetical protein
MEATLQKQAYKATRSALSQGRLTRQNCRDCADPNTHAHHEDYNKPLDIIWLCPSCHKALHWRRNPRRKPKTKPFVKVFRPVEITQETIDAIKQSIEEYLTKKMVA